MEEKKSRETPRSTVIIYKSVQIGTAESGKEIRTTTRTNLSSKIRKGLEKMPHKNSTSLRAFVSSMIKERWYLDSGCS